METAPGSGSVAPAQRHILGGWFGNLPSPGEEGGIHHQGGYCVACGWWAHCWQKGDAGQRRFQASAKSPSSSALKCVSDPAGESGFTGIHSSCRRSDRRVAVRVPSSGPRAVRSPWIAAWSLSFLLGHRQRPLSSAGLVMRPHREVTWRCLQTRSPCASQAGWARWPQRGPHTCVCLFPGMVPSHVPSGGRAWEWISWPEPVNPMPEV